MRSRPRRWNLVSFRWIYVWTFLIAVALQPAIAGLCTEPHVCQIDKFAYCTGMGQIRFDRCTHRHFGEALTTCDKAHLLPKGDNEIFMKVIAACLEREKLDLKRINLPCFNQDQVDVLVKCRGEAYAKATSNKASVRKKAADFKKCVDKAVQSKT